MHVKTFGKILRLDRIHEVQGFLACHVKILKNLTMYCWKKKQIFHEEKTTNCYKILNWLNKFLLVYIFARSVHNGVFVLKWLLSALISAHFQFIFCPTMSGKRWPKKDQNFPTKAATSSSTRALSAFPSSFLNRRLSRLNFNSKFWLTPSSKICGSIGRIIKSVNWFLCKHHYDHWQPDPKCKDLQHLKSVKMTKGFIPTALQYINEQHTGIPPVYLIRCLFV